MQAINHVQDSLSLIAIDIVGRSVLYPSVATFLLHTTLQSLTDKEAKLMMNIRESLT